MTVFRLASSEESRLVESFNMMVLKLNQMMLTQFHKDIEVEQEAIAKQRDTRSDPEHFYTNIFLKKVRPNLVWRARTMARGRARGRLF